MLRWGRWMFIKRRDAARGKTAWDMVKNKKQKPEIVYTAKPLECPLCHGTGQIQCSNLCPYFDGRSCGDVDRRLAEGCPGCPANCDNGHLCEDER